MAKKTLGGERLGAGKKIKVDTQTFNRSSFDVSSTWRSTISPGTLVPFMKILGLPGDTFDIDLEAIGLTPPTIGPLLGSFKAQYDVFMCPIRLYEGNMHNNMLDIGNNMENIKFPEIELTTGHNWSTEKWEGGTHPSSLLNYLGIKDLGRTIIDAGKPALKRRFNALPLLMYWDVYKNYYINKQQELGGYIYKSPVSGTEINLTQIYWSTHLGGGVSEETQIYNEQNKQGESVVAISKSLEGIEIKGVTTPAIREAVKSQLIIKIANRGNVFVRDVFESEVYRDNILRFYKIDAEYSHSIITEVSSVADISMNIEPEVVMFDLKQLDQLRISVLKRAGDTTAWLVNDDDAEDTTDLMRDLANYGLINGNKPKVNSSYNYSQCGLAVKTYQNDMLQNWLRTEWITEANNRSKINVVNGSITVDQINMANKLYRLYNDIAVSGGTLDDYLETVYDHEQYRKPEIPVYQGGMSQEFVFEEVISTSSAVTENGEQALGTLAGKGKVIGKKNGKVIVKCDEPCYIIGIVSITPRIDYSQGNDWDVNLKSMTDLHVPQFDRIGFQNLITEQMSASHTLLRGDNDIVQYSAGKQPAWMNYMTDVDRVFGQFAHNGALNWMVLNREYDIAPNGTIKDLTTYIDPKKFNGIFADNAITAENFWIQIGKRITARRKMSSKVTPKL